MSRSAAAAVAAAILIAALPLPAAAQDQGLERERLELDIQRLQRENSWETQAQRWLPGLSILVAAVVAGIGAWRYLDERKRERSVRIEEGVAHNLERVVDAPSEAGGSNARSIAGLRSLDALVRKSSRKDADERRTRVSETLTALVRDGLPDFSTPDHARLPVIYLDNWTGFRAAASTDHELSRQIAMRYVDHLAEMKVRRPRYVNTVRRDQGGYVQKEGSLDAADIPMFPALVTGFERYAAMLPGGQLRDGTIGAFSAVAPQLAASLFADQDEND
jgi:hypothetical protein